MIDKQPIRDFLGGLAKRDARFGDEDSLLATRVLDSLKIIELIAFLESHYQVAFDSDDLTPDNLDTVHAIAGLLERKGAS